MSETYLPNELNDSWNAELFAKTYGDKLRYCKGMKSWLCWNGTFWEKDEEGKAKAMAFDLVKNDMWRIAGELGGNEQVVLVKHRKKSGDSGRLDAMLLIAQSLSPFPVKVADLDTDPWLLNVQNGTIELKTQTLREHRQSDLITKIARFEFLDDIDLPQCPLFDAFLSRASQDSQGNVRQEWVDFCWRIFGLCSTGDISEEAFFVLSGIGQNGKGTFVDTMRYVLGDYAIVGVIV